LAMFIVSLRRVRRLRAVFPVCPYTTLFRSIGVGQRDDVHGVAGQVPAVHRGGLALPQQLRLPLARAYALDHRERDVGELGSAGEDRKSTRLNSSHVKNSYAVFCLKKKMTMRGNDQPTDHPTHEYRQSRFRRS